MKRFRTLRLLPALLLLVSCANSRAIDYDEPTRLLGKENNVRLDAQVFASSLSPNASVGVTFEVENLTPNPILVADIVPETTYDPDTKEITVQLGSEVPGNEYLPRLVMIRSGEKKTFKTGTRLDIRGVNSRARNSWPLSLRLKLNYLNATEPFETLVDIDEKAIYNPALADDLLIPWIDNLQAVTTNSIPINWLPSRSDTVVPRARPRF